mgnify:CR=1 FL=1
MSIMTTITQFIELLRTQTDRGIYVWGGNGHLLTGMSDPRGWIRKHETSTTNANRAIALYDRRVRDGVTEIRAFDCSGLIYWALNKLGLQSSDINSRGLYARCKPINKVDLRPGDMTFRHDGSKIFHVGVYMGNGNVIEGFGRDEGVIEHGIDAKGAVYWTHFGRFDLFEEGDNIMAVVLQHTSPMMQGNDIKALQAALNGLGYDCGTADGKAGTKTMAGIKAFVEAHSGLIDVPALPDTATLTITVGGHAYSIKMD